MIIDLHNRWHLDADGGVYAANGVRLGTISVDDYAHPASRYHGQSTTPGISVHGRSLAAVADMLAARLGELASRVAWATTPGVE